MIVGCDMSEAMLRAYFRARRCARCGLAPDATMLSICERTWRDLTDAQQAEFVSLLSELVVATYADRFDGYSGQQFVTDEVRSVRTGHVVRTRLIRETEADVMLDYFLRAGRVFNVVADGVSDLSLRRADYSSIIKSEGFSALLTHIQQKIDEAREED